MKTDLGGIPFDHYQRYATAADLVRTLGKGTKVLEVGANRQRLLGEFLPDSELLYTDLLSSEGEADFVVADACDLPFGELSYDAVVSLDVLEHIPPAMRAVAVREMSRVASRLVVIGCPIDMPWVHEAEHEAHAIWRRYFDTTYPWLEEHEEFGLVDPKEVERELVSAGLQCRSFGHGDVETWVALMGMHFMKEAAPELAGAVAAVDRFYNTRLFTGDRGAECYRQFFVGIRDQADVMRIGVASVLNGEEGPGDPVLVQDLSRSMQSLLDRLRKAEVEWRQTAQTLVNTESRLQAQAIDQHEQGVRAQASLLELSGQLEHANEQWRSTADLFQDAERRLQEEALAHHRTGLSLQEASVGAHALRAEAEELRAELGQARQYVASIEARHTTELQAAAVSAEAQLEEVRSELQRQALLVEDQHRQATELAHSRYEKHLQELQLRIKGLERRQRFALACGALLIVAGVIFAALSYGV